jgi:hypothetical protein
VGGGGGICFCGRLRACHRGDRGAWRTDPTRCRKLPSNAGNEVGGTVGQSGCDRTSVDTNRRRNLNDPILNLRLCEVHRVAQERVLRRKDGLGEGKQLGWAEIGADPVVGHLLSDIGESE